MGGFYEEFSSSEIRRTFDKINLNLVKDGMRIVVGMATVGLPQGKAGYNFIEELHKRSISNVQVVQTVYWY